MTPESFWWIAAAAFAASLIKLYSGFGLGTLLLPVFACFYPIPTAIALTAIVHLAGNLFKLALVGRFADRGILLRFGVPAVLAAFAGAEVLRVIPDSAVWAEYRIFGRQAVVTPLKVLIAALMLFFAAMEAVPRLKSLEFGRRWLILGGVLSGFFGGLSGHQGAFRSAFLTRSNLSVSAFVGTGAVIACGVDLTRLAVYRSEWKPELLAAHAGMLLVASLAAAAGAWVGGRFLDRIRIETIRTLVALLLVLYSAGLALGIL